MKIINYESLIISHQDYHDIQDQHAITLCSESIEALSHAYAPYSDYQVGAALRLENGSIIQGSNQENAVYPLGLCAERVALFNASSLHPGITIKSLAVTTKKELDEDELPPFPCGSCRQVILEIEQKQHSPIKLYMVGSNNSVCIVEGISNLLPFSFGRECL